MLDVSQITRPRSLDELMEQLNQSPQTPLLLAGGTDFLVQAKDGRIPPNRQWIDLTAVPELSQITEEEEAGQIVVGACCTYRQITHSALLQRYAPGLVQAAQQIGSVQIRNRATIGGNNANASPSGDTIPPLFVLDARVRLRQESGSREVPITEFFLGPGKTTLQEREVIEGFVFARRPRYSVFFKLGPREALACSKVSVSASSAFRDDCYNGVRIAIGAVAPTVIRATAAEGLLEGQPVSHLPLIQRAAEEARTSARPISDYRSSARYRKVMAGVLTARALRAMIQQLHP